ncbi:MAG TPA: SRPBCC family protein [Anaerolineae bacterium]|nr:SRPBCC family protein [Anaerolineae bacterium]
MITLRDTVTITAAPEDIFDFFIHFRENFDAWHPDHVRCWYLEEGPLGEGSVFYVEEYVGEELLTLQFLVTRLVEYSRIEYAVPRMASGAFIMEPRDSNTSFTAEIYFGTAMALLGALLDKILKRFMSHRLRALEEHMVDEGRNLKIILEQGAQWKNSHAEGI